MIVFDLTRFLFLNASHMRSLIRFIKYRTALESDISLYHLFFLKEWANPRIFLESACMCEIEIF